MVLARTPCTSWEGNTDASSLPLPHHHVVLRQGYQVWTYTHPIRSPRQIRRLTEWLFLRGHRALILQCDREHCRIYYQTYSQEDIERRLDQIRPAEDTYVQISPAPQS